MDNKLTRKYCNTCNCYRVNSLTNCQKCNTLLETKIEERKPTPESYENTAADDYLDYLDSRY